MFSGKFTDVCEERLVHEFDCIEQPAIPEKVGDLLLDGAKCVCAGLDQRRRRHGPHIGFLWLDLQDAAPVGAAHHLRMQQRDRIQARKWQELAAELPVLGIEVDAVHRIEVAGLRVIGREPGVSAFMQVSNRSAAGTSGT